MKRLAIPAVLVAAFLATGCGETQEVCRTYGNRTVCRTERVKTGAARERELRHSVWVLDWTRCVEEGRGSKKQCQTDPDRTGRESTHQLLPRANGWDGVSKPN